MAKKQRGKQSGSVQQKAKAMREAQQQADRRTRNIIITVVAVLSVAILAAVAFVLMRSPEESATGGLEGNLTQFAEGEPISISAEGVMGMDPEAHDVHLYFSYSCGACASLELNMSPYLSEGAEAGEYNLLIHPVITSPMAFTPVATGAALAVAADAPDQFVDFQLALAQFFMSATSTGDLSGLQDEASSSEAVAEVALSVGVPQEVVDLFSVTAGEQYLEKAQEKWLASEVEGREHHATPEFVVGDKSFFPDGETPEELYESLLEAVAAIK